MHEIKDHYLALREEVVVNSCEMSGRSVGFFNSFKHSYFQKHRAYLSAHYQRLNDIDTEFNRHFRMPGTVPDLNMLTMQLEVVSRARNLATDSLSAYETQVSNGEGGVNFRISTAIALFALVVSIVGIGI
jgi:hypothetical protein